MIEALWEVGVAPGMVICMLGIWINIFLTRNRRIVISVIEKELVYHVPICNLGKREILKETLVDIELTFLNSPHPYSLCLKP